MPSNVLRGSIQTMQALLVSCQNTMQLIAQQTKTESNEAAKQAWLSQNEHSISYVMW